MQARLNSPRANNMADAKSEELGEESNARMFHTTTQGETIKKRKKSATSAVRLPCAPIGAITDLICHSTSFLRTHREGRLGKSV